MHTTYDVDDENVKTISITKTNDEFIPEMSGSMNWASDKSVVCTSLKNNLNTFFRQLSKKSFEQLF